MKRLQRVLYVTVVLAILVLALGLRLRAVRLLSIDYDEDDYLGAAQRYAQFMAAGDVQGIVDFAYNYEHPPLSKLVYGVTILPLPQAPLLPEQSSTLPPASKLPQPHMRVARTASAVLGTLEVLALALLNPLAGLFLAIHTWQIKYTSQIMLEPLPSLMSALAVLCYFQARSVPAERKRRFLGWLILSGIALGLTAASKYTYCVVGLAVAVDFGLQIFRPKTANSQRVIPRKSAVRYLLLWGLIALTVFFAFNPRMWSDPLGRLTESLLYHGDYAQSAHVRKYNFPFWQPLVWLLGPVPWHPGVFVVALDTLITVLAAVGLGRLWRRYRVFALWLAIGSGFLLIWPTKWPQYILTITVPVCLAAAEGFRGMVWEPLLRWLARRGLPDRSRPDVEAKRVFRREARRAVPWLVPGIIALCLLALFPLLYQAAMALTDFNAISIRDGIRGGVWRAVWQGLTGQVKPVVLDVFQAGSQAKVVHYAGPAVLGQLLGGAAPDVLAFNVLWAGLSVGLQAVLGISAAFLLNRRGVWLRNLWRMIFILPWAIPEFVGALIWLRIFEPRYGWAVLAQRLPADVNLPNWFENPNTTLLILLIAATWYGFPLIMVAASAGLKLVPVEVYDAAAMDGAAGWNQFCHVTWPLLLPFLIPAIIVRGIFAFNQFYLFYTMRVGPPTVTFATASYFYFSPTGYFGGQFAISAAINIFTVLVLIGLILWLDRWTRCAAAEGVTYA